MAKPLKPAGPPLDRANLKDAALRHLSRFATTQAGLVRVLDRAIQRWAARAERDGVDPRRHVATARAEARDVAASLVERGLVDDAAFAAARAQRLKRAGRSRRATASHLAAKGVSSDLAATVLPGEDEELPSALAYARRRRIGPFRPEQTEENRLRDMASLARAGFPRSVAERAMTLDGETAEAMVVALRRG